MTTKGFAIYETKLCKLKIEYEDEYITGVRYTDDDEPGEENELTDYAFGQIEEFLRGERKTFDFRYKLIGTEFQKSVWNALCDIPYGETRSYKDIAVAIGNPKACRAVGMANNKNPIIIAVPCHRVIGSNGKLVGYGGGLDMKIALLDIEKERN